MKNPNWFTKKEVTYHRDVKAERKELIKRAKREAIDWKRQVAREKKEIARQGREHGRIIKQLQREKEREIRTATRKAVRARVAKSDIDPEAWLAKVRQSNPNMGKSKLKKGVKGLVRLEGRGKGKRLVIYT